MLAHGLPWRKAANAFAIGGGGGCYSLLARPIANASYRLVAPSNSEYSLLERIRYWSSTEPVHCSCTLQSQIPEVLHMSTLSQKFSPKFSPPYLFVLRGHSLGRCVFGNCTSRPKPSRLVWGPARSWWSDDQHGEPRACQGLPMPSTRP